MVERREFVSSQRKDRELIAPRALGMVPVMRLFEALNLCSRTSLLREAGSEPTREFPLRSMEVRAARLPREFGMEPDREAVGTVIAIICPVLLHVK